MVAVAKSVVPWKNSTLTIAPSLSNAVADIAMRAGAIYVALFSGLVTTIVGATLAGAMKEVLLIGLVRLTVGATLAGGFTVTLIAGEMLAAPKLSVALAVRLYVPMGTPVQVKV